MMQDIEDLTRLLEVKFPNEETAMRKRVMLDAYQDLGPVLDKCFSYIRTLEKDKKAMQSFLESGGPWIPCEDFEPDCYNCQGCKLLSSLHP